MNQHIAKSGGWGKAVGELGVDRLRSSSELERLTACARHFAQRASRYVSVDVHGEVHHHLDQSFSRSAFDGVSLEVGY